MNADFDEIHQAAIDQLELSLQQDGTRTGLQKEVIQSGTTEHGHHTRVAWHQLSAAQSSKHAVSEDTKCLCGEHNQPLKVTSTIGDEMKPRYLAICMSAGGMYKQLSEIDVSGFMSYTELFAAVKNLYRNIRCSNFIRRTLFRPVSIDYIQVSSRSIQSWLSLLTVFQ